MLNDDITRYIELHRALGFKYHAPDVLLRSFAAFADRRGDEFVRTQTALDWAVLAPSGAQRRNRLLTVRRFASAMQSEDEHHQLPPADAFGRESCRRGIRHIFTPEEITRLLRAAMQLAPKDSIRPATYATLFGLLAATGLRISEALALALDDVTDDGLIIRATKFHKDRLVPLHDTTQNALSRYVKLRARLGAAESSVFVGLRGTALPYSTVVTTFLNLARLVGLRPGPGQPGPRLHDLRHTFAVRSLEQCSGGQKTVARHTVALSTYLGHAHVSDTYWYLQATQTLMRQIAAAGEHLHIGEQP